MFNGIIKNTGKIVSILKHKNGLSLQIDNKLKLSKNDTCSSLCCSGVCLTVTNVNKKIVEFFLSNETLSITIFRKVKIGNLINIEKPLKYGYPISGHLIQGHIDTIGKIKKIYIIGKFWNLNLDINKKYKKYLVYKGSVAINGVSLTVSKVIPTGIIITVIPHTLKLTNLIFLKENDIVNVEFDILGKYIKNL